MKKAGIHFTIDTKNLITSVKEKNLMTWEYNVMQLTELSSNTRRNHTGDYIYSPKLLYVLV